MKLQIFLAVVMMAMTVTAHAQRTPQGVTYDAKIARVTDGDTVVVAAPFLPAPLKPEIAVRIWGVDTPETGNRAQCVAEDQQGRAATRFTRQAVAQSLERKYVLYAWDKYGGRVLGDIVLDGQSLRARLIEQGFAREYYGDAKQSWCR
jgi:endonuclease YncB( thermonuclease family)